MSRLRKWGTLTFAWLFLFCWITGFTAGLMAAACRKDSYEGEKKLRYCNISLASGAWLHVFQGERAKRAGIDLERGIALTQLGRAEEARAAFERALRDARAPGKTWERELHRRMARLEASPARDLWVSVVLADLPETID